MSKEVPLDIAVVGDSGVGKTSLMTKLCLGTFRLPSPTICMEVFYCSAERSGGELVKFHFFDTAGQERFRALVTNYYRTANGGVVVFDLQNRLSFENAKYWLEELRKNASHLQTIVLVGNKLDTAIASGREVESHEAEQFAIYENCAYFETSARTGANLNEMLIYLAEKIPKRMEERERVKETIRLSEEAWRKKEEERIRRAAKKPRCCRT